MSVTFNGFVVVATKGLQSHDDRGQGAIATDPAHPLFVVEARRSQPALEMSRILPFFQSSQVLFEQRVEALDGVGRGEEGSKLS